MSEEILIIKHIQLEGPGSIEEFFSNTAWNLRVIDLNRERLYSKALVGVAAIISLGGPMNVYEEEKYPFLKQEDILLKEAIKKEIPILGICLGAQLLAKATGAEVKRASTEEIGWFKVHLTDEGRSDPLFEGIERELDVFQWHQDSFELPEGGKLLAISNSCKNQAFRFGKNVYGLQFHIETTPSMVESWIKEYLDSDEQSKIIDAQKMLIDTYKKNNQFERQTNKLLLNFSRLIAAKAAVLN